MRPTGAPCTTTFLPAMSIWTNLFDWNRDPAPSNESAPDDEEDRSVAARAVAEIGHDADTAAGIEGGEANAAREPVVPLVDHILFSASGARRLNVCVAAFPVHGRCSPGGWIGGSGSGRGVGGSGSGVGSGIGSGGGSGCGSGLGGGGSITLRVRVSELTARPRSASRSPRPLRPPASPSPRGQRRPARRYRPGDPPRPPAVDAPDGAP
jgi:hypothetical protein